MHGNTFDTAQVVQCQDCVHCRYVDILTFAEMCISDITYVNQASRMSRTAHVASGHDKHRRVGAQMATFGHRSEVIIQTSRHEERKDAGIVLIPDRVELHADVERAVLAEGAAIVVRAYGVE
eukprot:1817204-Rhodomonas_salina.2